MVLYLGIAGRTLNLPVDNQNNKVKFHKCHVNDHVSKSLSGLQIRVRTGKLFFLLLNQYICCGYSKETSQSDGSFEHPKHMLKLMGKEINAILGAQTILIWTHGLFMISSLHIKESNYKYKFLFLNQNMWTSQKKHLHETVLFCAYFSDCLLH